MKTAVIVLSYNASKRIRLCLDSLIKQTYTGDYTVVVVDNASSDATAEIIKNEYNNKVFLIQNKKNFGFAGGNNIGMDWAYKNGYDAVILLNDDTKVRDTWLGELIATAEQNNNIGLVQSKILFADEAYRVNTIGNPLHFLGFSWSGGYKKLSSEFQVDLDIPLASGASVLIKRSVIERVGYLDDKLFMYHEDVDYSWRARLAGFDIKLSAQSIVFHDHKFSIGGKKFYYSERNRILVFLSHYKLFTILLLLPAFIGTEILMIVYAFVHGWGLWKVKSYLSIIMMLPHMLKKRSLDKKYRVIKDRDIINIQTYKLDFEDVNNILLKAIYNPLAWVYFKVLQFIVKW